MRTLLRLAPALMLLACSGPTNPDQQDAVLQPGDPGQTQVLVRTNYSGIDQRQRLVIRSQAELNSYWAQLYSRMSPAPTTPSVDFSTSVVVAASMGTRSSGGYAITVKNTTISGSRATVTVEETSPGANCITTQALTAPVVLAQLPRVAEVDFAQVSTVIGCD